MTVSSSSGFIVDSAGSTGEVTRKAVEERLRASTFFWLDLAHARSRPTSRSCATCSGSIRSRSRTREHFGQRPKLDEYDDYVLPRGLRRLPRRRTGWSRCTASTSAQLPGHRSIATTAPAFDRDARAATWPSRRAPIKRALLLLPGRRRARRQLLPGPRRPRRAASTTLEDAIFQHADDAQLQEIFADEAPARRAAQGDHAAARPVRAPGHGRRRRLPGHEPRTTSATSATSTTT